MSRSLLNVVLAVVVSLAPTAAAQDPQTFTGTITDSECPDAYHGRMRMGDTDAECARACVEAHGGLFVLFDGASAYGLSDQKAAVGFAGRRVKVTGSLDARTRRIAVTAIVPAG